MCMRMLQGGVDVDPLDRNKRSPLHYAVTCCVNPIIDMLLDRGSNPNLQDVDGNTPAHLAQMPKLNTGVSCFYFVCFFFSLSLSL